ncbi:unnamed protein product [Fraxinus pennsylvanica]|uniref:Uncharacterized protein n=1 Tax=Fraxinus pennsylvanica TaxID=56036 RepID=A0AAD1YVX5_9LAMI|nr:unnamed protein product [Fraxinus pennsylvanica]
MGSTEFLSSSVMALILNMNIFFFLQSRPFLKDRKKFVQMADPLLEGRFSVRSLHHAVAITAMCLQEQASFRPAITDIVTALEYLASQTGSSDHHKGGYLNQISSPPLRRRDLENASFDVLTTSF